MSEILREIEAVDGSTFANTDRAVLGFQGNAANLSGPGPISAVTVTNAGSGYTSLPTLGTSGNGSGASLSPNMKALAATLQAAGSGYAPGDTITLTGGTHSAAIVITVDTVSSGAIATFHISTAGSYSALPTNPVAQGSTSGVGTGATFNITSWGLASVTVNSGGSNYDSGSALTATGGGGSGIAGTFTVTNAGNACTTTITLPSSANLPVDGSGVGTYGVFINPGQDCRWYVPKSSKTFNSFQVVLEPKDGSTAIAAGTFDWHLVG